MISRRNFLKTIASVLLLPVLSSCKQALGIPPTATIFPTSIKTPHTPTATKPPTGTPAPTATAAATATPDMAAFLPGLTFNLSETALYLFPTNISIPSDGSLPSGAIPAAPPSGANIFYVFPQSPANMQAMRLELKLDASALKGLKPAQVQRLLEMLAASLNLRVYVYQKDGSTAPKEPNARAGFQPGQTNTVFADLRIADWKNAARYAAWTLLVGQSSSQEPLTSLAVYFVPPKNAMDESQSKNETMDKSQSDGDNDETSNSTSGGSSNSFSSGSDD